MLAGRSFAEEVLDIQSASRLGRLVVYDGRDEYAVAPDDRRRPAAAGNVGLPENVLLLAPHIGQIHLVRRRGGVRAAKLRPVGATGTGDGKKYDQDVGRL